ncbi:hypothetical protein BKH42_08725 [Helicobacter sp. 13S00482-2]|uniref:hypothetical protein n=1 Tax=Helicobacter sp. 13S00482-2 TaxID=1476200 RepID=UPI000BA6C74B|nr:hypothetical protein [Helicobacter sp. 13S00482-2]PAF52919.1 hypothetical protein BKH42_08725 [Helicobacter sp. 13S00482-2]
MKKTDLIIKRTKHFWKRLEERDIDLSALLDVYSKAAQTKAGNYIIGSNQNSSIVAKKISSQKVLLITAYENNKRIKG